MFATHLSRIASVAIAATIVLPIAAFADVLIPNGSFESGDLSSFGSVGTATVITTTLNGLGNPVLPTDGNLFACLSATGSAFASLEAPLGYLPGTLGGILTGISDGSIIYQNVNVQAGAQICFDFYFDALGLLPFNDIGIFSVASAGIGQPLILADLATVGNLGNTGWQSYEYTFANAGTYTIGFGALNGLFSINPSKLYVDNVRFCTTDVPPGDVPEPGVVAFGVVMGGSVLGLIARRRRS